MSAPEVKQLLLFQVGHGAAVRALDVVGTNLRWTVRHACHTSVNIWTPADYWSGLDGGAQPLHRQQMRSTSGAPTPVQDRISIISSSPLRPQSPLPTCRLGLTLTCARGTSSRLRLSCCASVFCASRLTFTLPSNTPRPLAADTMHLGSEWQQGQWSVRQTACAARCAASRKRYWIALHGRGGAWPNLAGRLGTQHYIACPCGLPAACCARRCAPSLVQLVGLSVGVVQLQLGVQVVQLAVAAEQEGAHLQ